MNTFLANKRWFIGGFVVGVLCLLVWILGPKWGTDAGTFPLGQWAVRVLLMLAILAVWLGGIALAGWWVRRRNRRMAEALAAESDADRMSRDEDDTLRNSFSEAMAKLQRARLGSPGNRQLLYELPWYVFIGAPGSGKTTALRKSGLRFPLAEANGTDVELQGIGGTRNCDWLFTERAVLIDTAGRYTTQDSNQQVDPAAWRTFLRLLKEHRPRQPINGIIVTLSVKDLLESDAAEMDKYGRKVHSRIEELQHELGMLFPVYVMVTKMDLISGFEAFFANFEPEQRAQVWGATLALDLETRKAQAARAGFNEAFPALVHKVNALLMRRLSEEPDEQARRAMYAFPQQLEALGPLISGFLDAAFLHSRWAAPALVRGVYFTSGTQEGAPIDRLIASMTKDLGLQPASGMRIVTSGSGKSYFIERLLTEVIFPEAGLAGHSEKRERQLRRLANGLAGAAAVAGMGLVGWWALSYVGNHRGLLAAREVATSAAMAASQVGPPTSSDLRPVIDLASQIAAVPKAVYSDVSNPPLSLQAGLYQGLKVEDDVNGPYQATLERALAPRIGMQLELALRSLPAEPNPDIAYDTLKAYVLLYDDDRRVKEANWFATAVRAMWRRGRLDPSVAEAAAPHLERLAASRSLKLARYREPDEALLARVRQQVGRQSLAQRALSRLKGDERVKGDPVVLSAVLKADGVSVLERPGTDLNEPLPLIFTAQAYRNHVKGLLPEMARAAADEESWVLGPMASQVARDPRDAALTLEVQRLYFDAYAATWRSALKQVRLKRVDGLEEARQAIFVLGKPDSPLKRLYQEVDRQTRLSTADGTAAGQATETARRVAAEKLGAAARGAMGEAGAAATRSLFVDESRRLELELEQKFAEVRLLVGDGKGGEFEAALAGLRKLDKGLEALQTGRRDQKAIPTEVVAVASSPDKLPEPLGAIQDQLVAVAKNTASGVVDKNVNQELKTAASRCAASVAGRFPFNPAAATDVGLVEFETVFRSSGDLDAYFNANLAKYVLKQPGGWRIDHTSDGAPRVSQDVVRQFQLADWIRFAFMGGESKAQVNVDVSVIRADADVVLDYDGTERLLREGARPITLKWPAAPDARMSIGGTRVDGLMQGRWALFRLVHRGQPDATANSGDVVRRVYEAGGKRATLEFRAASAVYNPLQFRQLEGFNCLGVR